MVATAYLDNAATTRVDPIVVEAMAPFLTERYGNPSSLHAMGRDAFRALEEARAEVARLAGAGDPREIVFTGSGTESDNAAVMGIAYAASPGGGHVVVSAFEHHAVLEAAERLGSAGYDVSTVAPDDEGVVHGEDLRRRLRDDTVLVCVMHVNNELGTVQPIEELAAVTHEAGAFFHTDVAQSAGKTKLDLVARGVDAASFSGHKVHAPKGTGVLFLGRKIPFSPLLVGGGHEGGRRSGTPSVAGAVGFATALRLMEEAREEQVPRWSALKDRVIEAAAALGDVRVNGSRTQSLECVVNLGFGGVDGAALFLHLDEEGIAVSTGSACSSGSAGTSHVLEAIRCPEEYARGSIRVSFGRFSTGADVDRLLEVLPAIVERLRDTPRRTTATTRG